MNIRITALSLIAALALLGAGCGKSEDKGKPIPSAQVAELNKQLDAVQRRFEHGDGACDDIQNLSEPAIKSLADQIPSSVDRKVRDSLRQSVDRLFQLTASQCDTTPTNTDTNTTPTDTTPTDTTPTDTNTTPTDTNTTPTDTQPTAPDNGPPGQQKQKKPKKQKDNGNGGGPAAPGGGG